VDARISLLKARADEGECDLVAKVRSGDDEHGFLYVNGTFRADRAFLPPISDAVLRFQAHLPGRETTYTCVPPGSGKRIAIDRDNDGVLDGDEHH
jgi:hypothetical protein